MQSNTAVTCKLLSHLADLIYWQDQFRRLRWLDLVSAVGVLVGLLWIFVEVVATTGLSAFSLALLLVAVLLSPFSQYLVATALHRLYWRLLSPKHNAAHQALKAGEISTALQRADQLLRCGGVRECPWSLLNSAIEIRISAGDYDGALALVDRCSDAAQQCGHQLDPVNSALVHINLAEALYSRGDHSEAAQLLAEPFEFDQSNPIVRQGRLQQMAWIKMLQGKLSTALELLDSVDPKGLPQAYHAEYFYTRAAVLRDMQQYEKAEEAAGAGLKLASRASSERNGHFMLGSIYARQDSDAALQAFTAGIDHVYKGQGGDALLEYMQFLQHRGDTAGAQRMRDLLVERDPQSAAAASLELEAVTDSRVVGN